LTGALRTHAELPVSCAPISVSVAHAAPRAACTVSEVRSDLMLIDGLQQ
jgi:hypothetical protein